MAELYLVVYDWYGCGESEYRVIGVATSEENAKALIEKYVRETSPKGTWDYHRKYCDIEKIILDEMIE